MAGEMYNNRNIFLCPMPEIINASKESLESQRQQEIQKVISETRGQFDILKYLRDAGTTLVNSLKGLSDSIASFFGAKKNQDNQATTGNINTIHNLPASPKNAPGKYAGDVRINRSSSLFTSLSKETQAHFDEIEKGLNAVAKKLNISSPALFALVHSESNFNPKRLEGTVARYASPKSYTKNEKGELVSDKPVRIGQGNNEKPIGYGLIQFTRGSIDLLGNDFSIASQMRGIEKYFSSNPAALTKLTNAQDIKLLTRWGINVNLAEARKSTEAADTRNFDASWEATRAALA